MKQLPTVQVVERILSALLRRTVHATPSKAAKPPAVTATGVYRSGEAPAVAACTADLAFAHFSSAAFMLIPADVAKENIKDGTVDETLKDSFGEVLNVLSRLFSETDGSRISLASKTFAPAPSAAADGPLLASKNRLDLNVEIEGYGSGLLCLRVA